MLYIVWGDYNAMSVINFSLKSWNFMWKVFTENSFCNENSILPSNFISIQLCDIDAGGEEEYIFFFSSFSLVSAS